MIRSLILSLVILSFSFSLAIANEINTVPPPDQDAVRIAALNKFWGRLSETVREGDLEGYRSLYHKDAVIVFATGKNKTSVSISKALSDWKQGFDNTKAGKQKDNVSFRLSQRIGNETTAHETGMFLFTSSNEAEGKSVEQFIHFEMLFVKLDGKWLATMEYQKSHGSEEEWNSLK